MQDKLGDKLKKYEQCYDQVLPAGFPIVVRLDGKAFHTFTRGLDKPYDIGLTNLMIETTIDLVKYFNARIGYTQSDEISLILFDEGKSEGQQFANRVNKLISISAAFCTNQFNQGLTQHLPNKPQNALFDSRVFILPEKLVTDYLIWRELDATRNSLNTLAQSEFSHKELQGLGSKDLHEKLHSIGINWNNYPNFFKRGTYVQKRIITRKFTEEELEKLPEKHNARKNPELEVKRTLVDKIEMPIFTSLINPNEVIFKGEEPKCLS